MERKRGEGKFCRKRWRRREREEERFDGGIGKGEKRKEYRKMRNKGGLE